jgi:GTP-binding protein Era
VTGQPGAAGFRSGFVAIVGRPNVGKSTLVNRLVGQKVAIVSEKPQTTRNRILAVVNRPGGQVVLFDTPGIHKPMHRMNRRMLASAEDSLSQVELAVWLVDVTQPYGPGDRHVRKMIKQGACKKVLLAVNKIDALKKTRILPTIEQYRTLLDFVEVVPLSARTGENVELLLERVLAQLPEGEPLYPEDFLTDRPERFFVAEMVREQVLAHTREELPYATGVIIEAYREEPEIVRIDAAILVERDSQKGIVIGKGGAMLKAIGSAARREIEAFLGARVFLGLFVKVRKDWRENPRALDEVGLDRGGRD